MKYVEYYGETMISIIIRTYNNASTIERAVKSALAQTFKDKEIIVVNDGSTDKTGEILNYFGSAVKVINQENKGALESGYVGLSHARGEYVFFLDGDDEMDAGTILELYTSLLETGEDYGFSYCDYYQIEGGERSIVTVENVFDSLVGGILVRREVLDNIRFWNKDFLLPEYDFLIRMMQKYKGIHVRKPLYWYYRHGGNMTANREFVAKAQKQIVQKYGDDLRIKSD